MITELSVSNFKSWKSIDGMRLAPITGLFGPNSSGKTSILQLLLMLKQTVESPDRAQALIFGDEKTPVSLGTFQDIVHGHKLPSTLSWRLGWELPSELKIADPVNVNKALFKVRNIEFEAEVEGENGRLAVRQMSYSFGGSRFSMRRKGVSTGAKYELESEGTDFKFVRTQGRPWPLPSPVKCYGFPDQVKAYYQNAGFLADLQLEFEKLFGGIYYLGPLREYPKRQYTWAGAEVDMGPRGERVVDALLAARGRSFRQRISLGQGIRRRTVEEHVAMWLQNLKLVHSFSIEPVSKDSNLYRVWVQKTRSSARVLITDVGFGVSQILPALVLCYYVPEGSTIILEQPEIHLHPAVQAGLADVFVDAVKVRNIQIIFESHSEHLLRRLQLRVAEKRLSTEDTALYFCQVDEEQSTLSNLDLDLFGNIGNWPKNFFGDEFGELAAITRAAMKNKQQKTG